MSRARRSSTPVTLAIVSPSVDNRSVALFFAPPRAFSRFRVLASGLASRLAFERFGYGGCFHRTSSRFRAALRDAMAPREISLAEVEKHVAYDDLWLVIAGKVYDVTAFMDDHPGGGEIMLNAAGKDGTDDFEDVGHSPNAYEQLKKFYIGEYAGGASGRADGGVKKSATGGMTTSGFGALGATLLPVAVLLLALLAAYVGRL